MSLPSSLRQSAARHGLNLVGLVDAERFDRCQPRDQRSRTLRAGCGTIVVLGTGGRAFWQQFADHASNGTQRFGADAVDELAWIGSTAVAGELDALGLRCRVLDSRKPQLNFGRLAEAAGFGTVSPVSGMLLHPDYGPWLRVRAALLLHGHPFGQIDDASITERFQPCCSCTRPCVSACPPQVHDVMAGSDRAKCADHRYAGGCDSGCRSRMACPLGAEHRDGDGQMLHAHSIGRRTMQRWFGLGVWRVVPRFLRGGPRA